MDLYFMLSRVLAVLNQLAEELNDMSEMFWTDKKFWTKLI